ncbi:MAG: hypothetical protein AAF958_15665 [Planctomycetota bacterium]
MSKSIPRYLIVSLVAGSLGFGTVAPDAQAQEGAAAAAVAATPAAAAATPAAVATAVTPAAAGTNTLWRYLAIPQTAQRLRKGLFNRRGNFPRLEPKPPILTLADPANLKSDNPAIQAAAKIKQAEDMKQQKIKAIKYLASIGCGCYDKDEEITKALIAATDDCTPDVRLAAIEAIEDNVNEDCCKRCGTKSCCNEKISKRLSEMAYERDDEGCFIEPSEEIRAAAKRVLCKCCPRRGYPQMEMEVIYDGVVGPGNGMIPTPEPGSGGNTAPPVDPGMTGEGGGNADDGMTGEGGGGAAGGGEENDLWDESDFGGDGDKPANDDDIDVDVRYPRPNTLTPPRRVATSGAGQGKRMVPRRLQVGSGLQSVRTEFLDQRPLRKATLPAKGVSVSLSSQPLPENASAIPAPVISTPPARSSQPVLTSPATLSPPAVQGRPAVQTQPAPMPQSVSIPTKPPVAQGSISAFAKPEPKGNPGNTAAGQNRVQRSAVKPQVTYGRAVQVGGVPAATPQTGSAARGHVRVTHGLESVVVTPAGHRPSASPTTTAGAVPGSASPGPASPGPASPGPASRWNATANPRSKRVPMASPRQRQGSRSKTSGVKPVGLVPVPVKDVTTSK